MDTPVGLQSEDQQRREYIDAIMSSIPDDVAPPEREHLTQFIDSYFSRVDVSDLVRGESVHWFGCAYSNYCLLKLRMPGQPRIRIFNPIAPQDGWHCENTVIEIVTDDMPYLLASFSMVLSGLNLPVQFVVHPILFVARDEQGRLTELSERDSRAGRIAESVMHIEIDRIDDPKQIRQVDDAIREVISLVGCVQSDSVALAALLPDVRADLVTQRPAEDVVAESDQLLAWLIDKHFSALGACWYRSNDSGALQVDYDSALGLLTQANSRRGAWMDTLAYTATSNTSDDLGSVQIGKASFRSPIVRPEKLDVVTVRLAGKDSSAMLCVIGLLAQWVDSEQTALIPRLRHKVQSVMTASGLSLNSHDGRTLADTIEHLPRDILFQSDVDGLLHIGKGVVALQERQRIRLFGSLSPDGLYVNCLVYIPRRYFDRHLRMSIESILKSALNGVATDFDSHFSSEQALARIHYVIQLDAPAQAAPDWENIEGLIVGAARSWDDRLLAELMEHHPLSRANQLYRSFDGAFSASYKEQTTAKSAFDDIAVIEGQLTADYPVMRFESSTQSALTTTSFRLYSSGQYVALSDAMPIIENMGLRIEDERPFQLVSQHREVVWIHRFSVQHVARIPLKFSAATIEDLQITFEKVWLNQLENDQFNRLIIDAVIDWRQTTVLRAYSKYLLQVGSPFSQAYVLEALVGHPEITALLLTLFEQRFDPSVEADVREERSSQTVAQIEQALEHVESLDHDRIMRVFLNLIQATVRTSYYRNPDSPDPVSYLSFKFDSAQVTNLPLPRPKFEIFVYSPRIEGIHLRGGKVARGGIRWSDRREDFRTEVLSLMKAQMTKNAVIVPVGSKGGFYVKQPPDDPSREAQLAEGIYCYQVFLRGLLDLTDNIVGDQVLPPPGVVRFDEDDPYLVVAADKGTATFSDYANAISEEYRYWLSDAFASGGSAGYDHKKMGITARGAWESVKRHFRHLNTNVQESPISVVGIGDMAGDVFGNGMLLSRQIRLIAAFNHQHIFIDPNPDPATSFAERERLFRLPRSSWSDFDLNVLSAGGAIFKRSAKRVTLAPEAMSALGTNIKSMTPNELITLVLRAPVDLLWNGGIGTYVKASDEAHLQVMDRTNDVVRVDAAQLQCKVIGEGGNLGLTQLARIEFAEQGGFVYTDAVDNSAGVDCSDHEVNIKVLTNTIIDSMLLTLDERNALLADMTDEVAVLVLQTNYHQTQCIDLTVAQAPGLLDEHVRFMESLEAQGKLSRDVEHLPNSDQIGERAARNQGLLSPEMAVLIAYSKMTLYDDLLASDLPDDPWLGRTLVDYFPSRLSRDYAAQVASHPLRREIITTVLTNQLVNRLGPSVAWRMQQELGVGVAEVTRAFVVVQEVFGLAGVWQSIEALDNTVPTGVQTRMQLLGRNLVERVVHWVLRSAHRAAPIAETVRQFKPGIAEVVDGLPHCLPDSRREEFERLCEVFMDAGATSESAFAVARFELLASAPDIVQISQSLDLSVSQVSPVYFELGQFLNLPWLRGKSGELPMRSHWHARACSALRSNIHAYQRQLAIQVLRAIGGETGADDHSAVQEWTQLNAAAVTKFSSLVLELKAAADVDFAMLTLAVSELRQLLAHAEGSN